MSTEIYFRNLKECIYTDFAWNLFRTQHDKVIQEGLYFVKIKDNKFICIEELLSNKKNLNLPQQKKVNFFVKDLVLINDLVKTKIK